MALTSWIASANEQQADFPIQNLPYGVFTQLHQTRMGVAIGDQILDLRACASEGLLATVASEVVDACTASVLNPLMALGEEAWAALRKRITELLSIGVEAQLQKRLQQFLVPMRDAKMHVPAQIGDYTDFYASIHHATRVGKLFRPDQPLLPNYRYLPIGYHGRASSIVVSDTEIRRPLGQVKKEEAVPVFGPSRAMDYELEVGAFVGPGNALGERIPIDEAEQHLFGICLLNDWSARDIQSWEYQPLGPFLAKSFATSISPWVVTMEALAPYRVTPCARGEGDPEPLPYLRSSANDAGALDVRLEVYLQSQTMRTAEMNPVCVSRGNLRHLYWTLAQLITHHASNGCNLRSGDLIATGTVSGPEEGSEGCLLEMRHRSDPLRLPTGETRVFLEDGDEVIFHAFAEREGFPRVGFGRCAGRVIAAR